MEKIGLDFQDEHKNVLSVFKGEYGICLRIEGDDFEITSEKDLDRLVKEIKQLYVEEA